MGDNLCKACTQWATRPSDERFYNLAEMHDACYRYDARRVVAVNRLDRLRVKPVGPKGILLQGGGMDASLSHWTFGQLAGRIGAPARYLRSLPASMTAELINYGLERNGYDGKAARLSFAVHDDETVQLESVTSDRYGYIPNWKITRGLQELERMGWRIPPADLYVSDRDMFAFLVNEDVVIDGGKDTGLNRGIFVENSEVGKGAFKITTFLYDAVCGNHIVWGASEVNEISVRHIGDADIRAFLALEGDLSKYAYESCRETEVAIATARKKTLGESKDQVVERLFGKRWLPKSTFAEAFDRAAELDGDRVDPTTVWGMVTGLTRVSQDQAWADERVHIDRVTGRLMAMAA